MMTPIRAAIRLVACLAWCIFCWIVILLVLPVKLVCTQTHRKLAKRIARIWTTGFMKIAGIRITIHGTPPEEPFCLVANHPSWMDFFVAAQVLPARFVVEMPMSRVPIVGRLMAGLDPIFVRRVTNDTVRVNEEITKTIEAGGSVALVPVSPKEEGDPTQAVPRFRGGLLQPAVDTQTPVHTMTISYKTPDGWPGPSQTVNYGPNPFGDEADGQVAPEEEKNFVVHVWNILRLPYHECILIFGEPLLRDQRNALADALQEQVAKAFVPLD